MRAAAARKVHCALYQEVCLDDKNIDGMKAYFTTKGWDSDISNTCPDNTKPTAGVAKQSTS